MTPKKIAETDSFIVYEPGEDWEDLDPIMKISEEEMPYIFAVWGFGPLNEFKISLNLDKVKLFSSKNRDTGKIKYRFSVDYKRDDCEIDSKDVHDLDIPSEVDCKVVIDNLDRFIRKTWGRYISQPKIMDFRKCKNIDDMLKVFGLNESQIKKVKMRIPKKRKK